MYLARDKNGCLCLYTNKPIKDKLEDGTILDGWSLLDEGDMVCLESVPIKGSFIPKIFPEVKWEDEEPTEVELIIKNTMKANKKLSKKELLNKYSFENYKPNKNAVAVTYNGTEYLSKIQCCVLEGITRKELDEYLKGNEANV